MANYQFHDVVKTVTRIDRRHGKRQTPMKVLVLGLCRTGTDSLRQALRALGYNDTYHGYMAALGSPRDCELWYEALRAKYDGVGKPFGREDFDQLLGNCQAACDFPAAAFSKELIEAYPEAKVILTDRDVDEWHSSVKRTFQPLLFHPLFPIMQLLENLSFMHTRWLRPTWTKIWTHYFNDNFEANGRKAFEAHYASVREMIPPENLLIYKTLAQNLNGTATDAFWAGTSFLLANAVCQPVVAAISEIFGRRDLLVVMISVFSVGTAIACSAHAFPQLLAGRSVQGIGAGGIFSMVLAIFTDIVPLRLRPRYWAAIQVAWAVGTVTGPVIGGACAHPKTWRWEEHSGTTTKGSFLSKWRRLDFVGCGLFLSSTTSFLIGVTWGGVQYDWDSVQVLVPIFLGLAGIISMIVWEKWGTENPFLRIWIFDDLRTTAAYLCGMLQGLILFAKAYYVAIYLEGVKLFDPLKTGLSSLPMTAGMLPISVIAGILMTHTGRYRWCLWTGWPLTTLASGLLILLDSDTKTAVWVILLIIAGVGHGFLLGPGLFAAQATCSQDDVAVATSVYSFLRSFGMCLGVATGGTMFQNVLKDELGGDGFPAWIATDATAYAQKLRDMQDTGQNPVTRQKIQDDFALGFQAVMALLTGIGGLGFALSLIIKKRVMN
ncbi:hypothetical protein SI65_05278 [Aspergillus cristatus]|uniref:Major facilitator superfamily (MFS) profile domain-containing protein n=1 Tax=Aspergillus cristatus TaxID=573508 RepID=A0A1E3BD04_ASPCR|nr:hypothetical protein SI65_05278 [Aspergillus cristatus]